MILAAQPGLPRLTRLAVIPRTPGFRRPAVGTPGSACDLVDLAALYTENEGAVLPADGSLPPDLGMRNYANQAPGPGHARRRRRVAPPIMAIAISVMSVSAS